MYLAVGLAYDYSLSPNLIRKLKRQAITVPLAPKGA
ncbi:hypothetical protein ESCOCK349B_11830 [Escherichia coli]